MAIDSNASAYSQLKDFIPLNQLSDEDFKSLCRKLNVEERAQGDTLFEQGETSTDFTYILEGKIKLVGDGIELDVIEGGSSSARFAIAHQIPRKVSAQALTTVLSVRIAAELLDQFDKDPQKDTLYETAPLSEEQDENGDWMTHLLRSPIFQQLPPANLQKVLRAMEEIKVKSGNRIIHQGDEGDYYYIIKRGRCVLTRRPTPNAKEIKLAELKTCDTFGEDALISGEPRNVNVTMATDGELLRLNKEMFQTLVQAPVIRQIDYQEIDPQTDQLLDVRSPDMYELQHLPDSLNIPFFSLRMQMGSLSKEHRIIVICDDGSTSEAACFLLIRNGFRSVVLRGGIHAAISESSVAESAPGSAEPPLLEEVIEHPPVPSDAPIHPASDMESTDSDKAILSNQNEDATQLALLDTALERKDAEIFTLEKHIEELNASNTEQLETAQLQITKLEKQLLESEEALQNYKEEVEQAHFAARQDSTPVPEESSNRMDELMDRLHDLEIRNLNLHKRSERVDKLKSELEKAYSAYEKLREQSNQKIIKLQQLSTTCPEQIQNTRKMLVPIISSAVVGLVLGLLIGFMI